MLTLPTNCVVCMLNLALKDVWFVLLTSTHTSKLPKNPFAFYFRLLDKIPLGDKPWYCGVNKIKAEISAQSGLQVQVYTVCVMDKFPFRFVAVPVPFITVYVYVCVVLPFHYRASVHSNTFSTSGFTSNWNAAAILTRCTPRSGAVRLVVFVVSSLRAFRRAISASALRAAQSPAPQGRSCVTRVHEVVGVAARPPDRRVNTVC